PHCAPMTATQITRAGSPPAPEHRRATVKILTTIRRVPDLDARFGLNADQTQVETAGLEHKINYFDEVAVEEAIRLREKGADISEIVAVCIGAEEATKE